MRWGYGFEYSNVLSRQALKMGLKGTSNMTLNKS